MAVSVHQQVENVRSWNAQRDWGLSNDLLEEALARAAGVPEPDELAGYLPVLVPYLGSVQRTFDELWTVAAAEEETATRDASVRSEASFLRLLPGIEHPSGLRWEYLALRAHRGEAPRVARDTSSAHAGVLAALAQLPRWRANIGDRDTLDVAVSGYQMNYHGQATHDEDWRTVPYLTRPGLRRTSLELTEMMQEPARTQFMVNPTIRDAI